jgi:ParB family chromosome partitioning protein
MKQPTVFKSIPIDCLQRGQYQPRTLFPEEGLRDLAQSILSQGLIEPLVVRKITDTTFEIIAGERRWRAAMLAGLSEVPCLIGHYTDQQTAAITLIENIQRQNLSLLEEANGYQRLTSEFNFNQSEVAVLVGKSRSHVANLLRLLTLCTEVQECLHQGQFSLGHARMLVGLETAQQKALAKQVVKNQWSVRKLEEEVRTTKLNGICPPNPSDIDIIHLEAKLTDQIGAPVHILTENSHSGWLKIKFYDPETLAGLLDRMGLRYDEII